VSYDLLGWLGAVDGDLNDPEFRVLFRLCWHANQKTGEIYPSLEKLAEGTGMHARTVMRHVKSLEAKKYIEVERGRWANGTQKVNRYVVCADVTYRMPGDREVTVTGKIPVGKPGDNTVTWTDQPGDNPDADRVTVVSPNKEGRVKKEETPLSYGEDTPKQEIDLFGKQEDAPKIELHDRVMQAWNKLAQRRPGIAAISTLNDSRRKKIHARAKDMAKVEPDGWKAWQQILIAIEASTYLCGEDAPGRGYTDPFKLNLEFVLRPSEFLKIYDGGYRATRTDKSHDPVSGRRIGPAEQASRAAFTRIRDARAERGSGAGGRGGEEDDGSGGVRTGPLRSAFDQY
jgi:DNA-binding transcriptional ArsR family regulator